MSADLSFSARVAQQLAQIKHGPDCASHPFAFAGGPQPCDCDRDQRVAAAVARAIEAACRETANYLPTVSISDRNRAEGYGQTYALGELAK